MKLLMPTNTRDRDFVVWFLDKFPRKQTELLAAQAKARGHGADDNALMRLAVDFCEGSCISMDVEVPGRTAIRAPFVDEFSDELSFDDYGEGERDDT